MKWGLQQGKGVPDRMDQLGTSPARDAARAPRQHQDGRADGADHMGLSDGGSRGRRQGVSSVRVRTRSAIRQERREILPRARHGSAR